MAPKKRIFLKLALGVSNRLEALEKKLFDMLKTTYAGFRGRFAMAQKKSAK